MSDPLWWYDSGSREWEREVSRRVDEADWDALEATVRAASGLWHVVITYPDGRQDRLGPYQADAAFGLALGAQEWDARVNRTGPRADRTIDLEPVQ